MAQALDLLLGKMQEDDFPFSRVAGVSGSGQQHGSVFWREGAGVALSQLRSSQPLHQQLQVQLALHSHLIYCCCVHLTGQLLRVPVSSVEGLQYHNTVCSTGGGMWRGTRSCSAHWLSGI